MGEEFSRIMTWPFGDLLFPEKDTSGGGQSAPAETVDTGTVTPENPEVQASQRRLARMSKYFTTPTGVLAEAATGKTGVFS